MKISTFSAAFVLAAILAFSFPSICIAGDSDALIEQITNKNSSAKTRSGKFVEERKRHGKQAQDLEGELVYEPEGKLSMNYSKPSGDFFIIEDGFLSMKNNGVENKFDLSRNKPMKSLSDLLISSFAGKLQDFASQNACTISAEKTSTSVQVTLEATKKAVKGYSKVIVDYDPKTFLLSSMVMEEFDGSVTTYKMK